LQHLRVRTLVLTGFAGNNCVLFTANDAYLRDYELIVPADCTASISTEENEYALKQMQQVLKASIPSSSDVNFIRGSRKLTARGGALVSPQSSPQRSTRDVLNG
jgi:nicotinamidase-related amidase